MQRILHRRDFLRLSGATLAAGTATWLTGCARLGQAQPEPTTSGALTPNFQPDVELALRATSSEVALLDGAPTRVQTFRGEVLNGDAAVLQALPNSYLGPIIRVRRGQNIRVHFTNEIDSETIVHWHGLHVPAAMDGHPRDVIAPGETYVYEFQVNNRAGTYWFHPHPHGRTGPQVYAGLAGLFLVSDDEEAALGLPADEADIPLIIQDRTFDSNNQFVYAPNGMMDQTMGMLGERILVNGRPDYTLPVATRAYRLRVLNGSNSRIYKLAWDDGTPLTVIASDGGLLTQPVQRDFVLLAPGERVELWADFRERAVGTEFRLRSLPFEGIEMDSGMMDGMMGGDSGHSEMMGGDGGHSGMMGGMQHGTQALPNGAELSILTVRVEQNVPDSATLPQQLAPLGFLAPADALNRNAPRTFTASMGHMEWLLNGRSFEMEAVAQDENVQLGATEIWEFINQEDAQGRLDMMGMAHPIHIHGMQFQVIERTPPSNATLKANWEAIRAGYIDEGWKDTFLMMPGERVKILLRFADYEGLYLYHCHMLEHEDSGMMRNYRVSA
jgi:FtsP/CotA-like multicopper oxidase with cupredoxin domain